MQFLGQLLCEHGPFRRRTAWGCDMVLMKSIAHCCAQPWLPNTRQFRKGLLRCLRPGISVAIQTRILGMDGAQVIEHLPRAQCSSLASPHRIVRPPKGPQLHAPFCAQSPVRVVEGLVAWWWLSDLAEGGARWLHGSAQQARASPETTAGWQTLRVARWQAVLCMYLWKGGSGQRIAAMQEAVGGMSPGAPHMQPGEKRDHRRGNVAHAVWTQTPCRSNTRTDRPHTPLLPDRDVQRSMHHAVATLRNAATPATSFVGSVPPATVYEFSV
jgi:hypothetical protein